MISARKLYRKIKAKYPDFRPPKPEPNNFDVRKKPPLTEQQLQLLENGFPVRPNYEPHFYEDSKGDLSEVIDKLLESEPDTKQK